MRRMLLAFAVLFPLLGTPAQAQTLTDEGRLTTLDVEIIRLHAELLVLCPGKPDCVEDMSRVIEDTRAIRKRMEKFFKSKRLETERLAINAELERIAQECERLRKKYDPVTRTFA